MGILRNFNVKVWLKSGQNLIMTLHNQMSTLNQCLNGDVESMLNYLVDSTLNRCQDCNVESTTLNLRWTMASFQRWNLMLKSGLVSTLKTSQDATLKPWHWIDDRIWRWINVETLALKQRWKPDAESMLKIWQWINVGNLTLFQCWKHVKIQRWNPDVVSTLKTTQHTTLKL